jgi:hypothetical protein
VDKSHVSAHREEEMKGEERRKKERRGDIEKILIATIACSEK